MGDLNIVRKYWKENLTLAANSSSYEDWINTAYTDDNTSHLFISGRPLNFTNRGISKLNKENLTFVANSINVGNFNNGGNHQTVYGLISLPNSNYIYAGGDARILSKFEKTGSSFEQKKYYVFNKWLINNDTTLEPLLVNAKIVNAGNFNGENYVFNPANFTFLNNSENISSDSGLGIFEDGEFLYTKTGSNLTKLGINNMTVVAGPVSFTDGPNIILNNGVIYGRTSTGNVMVRRFASNLASMPQLNLALNNGAGLRPLFTKGNMVANNGFVFIGYNVTSQNLNNGIVAIRESNFTIAYNTNQFTNFGYNGVQPNVLGVYDGFVYSYVGANVSRWFENNLVFAGSFMVNSLVTWAAAFNNNYMYLTQGSDLLTAQIYKYSLINFSYINKTTPFVNLATTGQNRMGQILIKDNFLYTCRPDAASNITAPTIMKYHEDNLVYVTNVQNQLNIRGINSIVFAQNNLYALPSWKGSLNFPILKYQSEEVVYDNIAAYEIKSFKEDQ
jgi:hypothetical protein